MAEIEGAFEIIEEAEEGFEDAGEEVEDMTEEEKAEFEEEVEEAKKDVGELKKDAKKFKDLLNTESTKKFAIFVAKNIAVGAILYGVNLALSKLTKAVGGSTAEKKSNKKKMAVVKAITKLIQTETDDSKNLRDWLTKHKDETITLGGINVPLVSIFHDYLGPISDAVDEAYNAAKPLQKKIGSKVTTDIPTADDIAKLIEASAAFLTAFDKFRKFAVDHSSQFPTLQSLPLTQADITNLNSQLDAVKKLPYY
ncbi:uncharacterized protein [Amphiura filiformis]|uniref:uncharacterized protein isoform X2 n=1 Tax=Amphiura filiformis TaxID=82378 RepID=UPI003B226A76